MSSLVKFVRGADLDDFRKAYRTKRKDVDENGWFDEWGFQNDLKRVYHQAVSSRRPDIVECLIELGETERDIFTPDGKLITHYAVETNCVEMVDVFIKYRFDFELRFEEYDDVGDDDAPYSVLHIAAHNSHSEIMQRLVTLGIKDEPGKRGSKFDGLTALHVAVMSENAECVKLLLEAGSNVDETDKSKKTALHLAAANGYNDIVELLIKHGAKLDLRDEHDCSPWMVALRWYKDIAEIIEEALSESGVDVLKSTFVHGFTYTNPLAHAVRMGSENATKYLISRGGDLSWQNNSGTTLLMLAAFGYVDGQENIFVLKLLLSHEECRRTLEVRHAIHGTVLQEILSIYCKGEAPHHIDRDIICDFLEAGANVNGLNTMGIPHIQQYFNKPAVLILLALHGANLNFNVPSGNLLFSAMKSVAHGDLICNLLLELNIDIGLTKFDSGINQTKVVRWDFNRPPKSSERVRLFPLALCFHLKQAKLMYYSGCSVDGFKEFMASEKAAQLCVEKEGFKEFTDEVAASGRESLPFSLLEIARQAILRGIGNGGRKVTMAKISTFDFPIHLVECVKPFAYKMDVSYWHAEMDYSIQELCES